MAIFPALQKLTHIGTLFQDHAVVSIATALMVYQPLRNEVWRI